MTPTEDFISERGVCMNMEGETTLDDLTAEEMFAMLKDSPDRDEFSPGDLAEYAGRGG